MVRSARPNDKTTDIGVTTAAMVHVTDGGVWLKRHNEEGNDREPVVAAPHARSTVVVPRAFTAPYGRVLAVIIRISRRGIHAA